ncbi:MAG TPA: RidA family protein [Gemmatimonadales bacterium]|nr:RidA family protein [Gemmatimonadales bacterium]
MSRKLISSGSPYERQIGFSRAVRCGTLLAVSGTAPLLPDGTSAYPGDLYRQVLRCLEIIVGAVEQGGGRKEDIIRTRLFLTDISRWEEAARAHGEFFAEVRPASTFVEVSRLIRPEWLVEIEADCVVTGPRRQRTTS